VFGPGWTADLPGAGDGYGEYGLVDTSAKGTVTLQAPDGTQYTYLKQANGTYVGTGEAADGSVLTSSTTILDPTGATQPPTTQFTGWQLKDVDGTVTTWTLASTSAPWLVKWVDAAGLEGETTYARDSQGRVTTILGPTPTGVTCTTSSVVRGCVALTLAYATTTTATSTTPGTYVGRTSQMVWKGWNPDAALTTKDCAAANVVSAAGAMAAIPVACYAYDTSGRLVQAWDPRITPVLKTVYAYVGTTGRLLTVTPPGRNGWTLAYDTSGRVASATRTDPNTAGPAKTAVAYGVPVSGTGLPDLSGSAAATWGQTAGPSGGLAYAGGAVFPPSQVPTVNGTTGAYTPTSTQWKYGQLTYADVNGRTTNTAVFGAGGWQIDSNRYDSLGRDVWSLPAGLRAQALTPTVDTDPYVASQTTSAARADLLASTTSYDLNGDVASTLDPAHPVRLSGGVVASVRTRTSYTYDEQAPAGGPFHLVTTTTTTPVALDGSAVPAADTRVVKTGYAPIDGASVTGPTSGWTLYAATTSTVQLGTTASAADLTTKTRYDSSGRTVEARLPDATGTDPATTLTTYYTAAANGSVPSCGVTHPEWAGLVCRTAPAGVPNSGPAVPTTDTTYSKYGDVAGVIETSGAATRTTTISYDGAGRPGGKTVTATGLTGSTAVPAQTITYSTTTGDPTTITAGGVSISSVVNAIGQTTSVTDADANTSTSTYDVDGNLKTVNDGKGTTTYTYDGGSGATEEHRGLPTSVNTGMGAAPSTFTAVYNAAGQQVSGTLPNGTTVARRYDTLGTPTALTYTLPVGGGGTSNVLAFTNIPNAQGQIAAATSIASAQGYGYDNAGRLTAVADTTPGGCTTRGYGFDKQSDRTSLTTYNPGTGGACQTSTAASTVTTAYDTANRITTATGYSYDPLGRATTIPQAHLAAEAGNLTVGYHDTDLTRSLTQGTSVKTFTLDPAGRYRQATDTTTSGVEARRIINHYSSGRDSPSWIATSTNAGSTWTWQRYVQAFGGLAATQDSDGTTTLNIANLHGDLVATIPNQTTGPGTATSSYTETTEYGLQRPNAPTPARYGWLGAAQRSTDALGRPHPHGRPPLQPHHRTIPLPRSRGGWE
jgi:YD repeat-containing protein